MTTEQANQLQYIYDRMANGGTVITTCLALGSGDSFNVRTFDGYEKLTVDNFIVELVSASATAQAWKGSTANSWISWPSAFTVTATILKSYDASTGIFTVSGTSATQTETKQYGSNTNTANHLKATATSKFNVYLFY